MTTLAKLILKADPKQYETLGASEKVRKLQNWTHGFVRSRLLAPVPGTPGVSLDQCAERFIFDEDPTVVTYHLVETGQIANSVIFETVRFPATHVWIEFPHMENRLGYMVGPVLMGADERPAVLANQQIGVAMVASNEAQDKARVCAFLTIPSPEIVIGQTYCQAYWFLDKHSSEMTNEESEEVAYAIHDLVHCLFMINTPRVSEHRVSTIGSSPKRAAKDPTTFPAVEVKRVVLKVGVGAPRYPHQKSYSGNESVESADARHRRLHRVIGHFRTYREGREKPHVSFVPQHWRGDASLGILLHERVVKK